MRWGALLGSLSNHTNPSFRFTVTVITVTSHPHSYIGTRSVNHIDVESKDVDILPHFYVPASRGSQLHKLLLLFLVPLHRTFVSHNSLLTHYWGPDSSQL